MRKNILNGIFVVVVLIVTLVTVFRDKELDDIVYWMNRINKFYLFIGAALVPVFVSLESVIIWFLLKSVKIKHSFLKCLKYSFIGFFFSCITPSATGGQPVQVYYMKRDGLRVSLSSAILLIVTIAYKAVLVVLGFAAIIFCYGWLKLLFGHIIVLFWFGMAINVGFIVAVNFLLFSKSLATVSVEKTANLLEKLKILKANPNRNKRIEDFMVPYHRSAGIIKDNAIKVFVWVFIISVVQRVVLFAVTYCVYVGFGLSGTSAIEIIFLQGIISLCVDMLPLPGGMGASENIFMVVFKGIFGSHLVVPAVLLSRGIGFYFLVIISGFVTMMVSIFGKNNGEERL